jgi:hypothetical protein
LNSLTLRIWADALAPRGHDESEKAHHGSVFLRTG